MNLQSDNAKAKRSKPFSLLELNLPEDYSLASFHFQIKVFLK
jgi:hypothetical protein